MAFWQKLEQRATETTVKAMQKAKDLSDVAKYTTLLADEEKKMNNIYLQIGQLYASLHADTPEAPFVSYLQQLKESNQKIEEYRHQVQVIKGVQTCPKCGAEVPINSAFCSVCGSAMAKPISEQVEDGNLLRCPNCGSPVQVGAKFCTACGNLLAAELSGVTTEESSAQPPKCPQCGAIVENGAAFCTLCGAKL